MIRRTGFDHIRNAHGVIREERSWRHDILPERSGGPHRDIDVSSAAQ